VNLLHHIGKDSWLGALGYTIIGVLVGVAGVAVILSVMAYDAARKLIGLVSHVTKYYVLHYPAD
jgi:hypothetical protein